MAYRLPALVCLYSRVGDYILYYSHPRVYERNNYPLGCYEIIIPSVNFNFFSYGGEGLWVPLAGRGLKLSMEKHYGQ